MTTESFMDQIKAFGARLGLPRSTSTNWSIRNLRILMRSDVPHKPLGKARRRLRTSNVKL
jgi:hypothetical protein